MLRSFYYKIKPVIIINKIDLLSAEELEEVKKNLEFLNKLDIKYFLISQKENIGIEELKVFLKDKITAFGGPSGVGKSSIINLLQNEKKLETGETSKRLRRGKHTTKDTNLLELIGGGYIIDTPGFSSVELPDIKDAQDTINKVIDLAPDDITLHALALKKGSELKLIRDNIVLPDDETVQAMAKIMTTAIDEYGLIPYYIYRQGYMSGQLENVGYSKKGQEGIYNIQIMGERQTILGVGGAATSKITYPGKRLQTSFNAKDLYTYLNSIDKYIERRAMLLKEAYGD